MYAFKLHILESCLGQLEDISSVHSVLGELFTPQSLQKIGSLEISCNTKTDFLEDCNFQGIKSKNRTKRKQSFTGTGFLGKKRNQVQQPVIEPGKQSDDSILMNKVTPESLINISQSLSTGERSFQCSMCGYVSNQKGAAKRHIELKHLPKTMAFRCQMCEYTTSLRFHLKGHYTGKHNMPEGAAKKMMSDD